MNEIYDVAITNDNDITVSRGVVAIGFWEAFELAQRAYRLEDEQVLNYSDVKKITISRIYKTSELIEQGGGQA